MIDTFVADIVCVEPKTNQPRVASLNLTGNGLSLTPISPPGTTIYTIYSIDNAPLTTRMQDNHLRTRVKGTLNDGDCTKFSDSVVMKDGKQIYRLTTYCRQTDAGNVGATIPLIGPQGNVVMLRNVVWVQSRFDPFLQLYKVIYQTLTNVLTAITDCDGGRVISFQLS